MAQQDDYDDHDDIGWFRDQLRQRDRELADLKHGKDELSDLVRRFDEYVEDYNGVLEQWKQATFGMVQNDDGIWTWDSFWDDYNMLTEEYKTLVKRYNRLIPLISVQHVGRPLAASEAQIAAVTRLHRAGNSLRWIVDETTNRSLRTVRTIVGRIKISRTERMTKKRLQRIEIYKSRLADWKSQKRTLNALPTQVRKVIDTGNELVNQAKGLGT
jgi:hypothetical protein